MRRWGVLISGRGSNLGALLDARDGTYEVGLVLSSSAQAYGLLRARRAGVRAELTPLIPGTRKIDWVALHQLLLQARVTHVFLAGFMKIVPESFLARWERRILNLHPSLLPAYPGLNSIERAHREGAALGVTVHEVIKDVDAGRLVCQRRCLNEQEVREYSLGSSELLMHIDEQRVIKEAIRRWKV
jgi:phosphoribosylglycinamide formyltransferase 1